MSKTPSDYVKKENNDLLHELYLLMEENGKLGEDVQENMKTVRTAFNIIQETMKRGEIHSREDEWTYADITSKELSEALSGTLLMLAIALRMSGSGPLCIHQWCEADSFVMALAEKRKQADRLIAVVSFCNITGDHFELFDRSCINIQEAEDVILTAEDITGFRSYDAHNLNAYLVLCNLTAMIDRKGLIVPENDNVISVPGASAFAADDTGMDIVRATMGCR